MFLVSCVLAILGFIMFFSAAAWIAIAYGKTRKRTGAHIGAEMMSQSLRDSLFKDDASVKGAYFWGKGVAVDRTAIFTTAEIKSAWKSGNTRLVIPLLIAAVGFEMMVFFGGVSLLLRLEDKIIGAGVIGASVYALWIVGSDFYKA